MIGVNEIVRQYPTDMQKPEFYEQMVKEYLHHQMLRILFKGKYADKIQFLGGTALRYFYDIKRFSEDLDFDCFDFSKYEFIEMTNQVEKEIKNHGYHVMIEDKEKFSKLNAFRRVFVFPELKYNLGLSQQKEAKFFIKIEVEPHHYTYKSDTKILNGFGISAAIRTVPLSIMFSSKISAAIRRSKDRDFYDVIHLIGFASPDFGYLRNKCNISNSEQLKMALLKAAKERNLEKRKVFDCEHMLFNKLETEKLRSFSDFITHFDFGKFST